jgi:hypothetical protein
MEFVKQKHDRGCCVACAAMLTGRSYDDVWHDQLNGFGTEEAVLGLRLIDWRVYLSHMGFETGMYEVEGSLLEAVKQLPKGVRFLCSIGLVEGHPKSDPHNTHAIILDETGVVFDPATDAPGTFSIQHYMTSPKTMLHAFSVHDRRLLK